MNEILIFEEACRLIKAGFILVDKNSEIVFHNQYLLEIFKIQDKNINTLKEKFISLVIKKFITKSTKKQKMYFKKKLYVSNNFKWGLFSVKQIKTNNKNLYLIVIEDITSDKQKLESLYNLARYDSLTGLFNKMAFSEQLQGSLRRLARSKDYVVLAIIDLDGFKHINDCYGHTAGDHVLKTVAERIKNSTRVIDFISRHGGDEYSIIMENVACINSIKSILKKINEACVEPIIFNETKLILSCSIGVCVSKHADSLTADYFYEQADLAMYKAKNSGRNRFEIIKV